MTTEFRKAEIPAQLRALASFDRRVFSASDAFPASYWRECEAWWMLIDGRKAGCCAFELHRDFTEDIAPDGENPPREGTLYIATTGLLPKYQGKGLGAVLKAWEIAYATRHGFNRIVTNTRKRNARMIALNSMFGFTVLRTTPRYYDQPTDATVVMELVLEPPKAYAPRSLSRRRMKT
jgi:GNAT superfamily N-acetyltransferase